MTKNLLKIAGVSLLIIGVCGAASAAFTTPEIDPASGANAIALLAGALLMIRGRRRR